jgi:HSP20 family protein
MALARRTDLTGVKVVTSASVYIKTINRFGCKPKEVSDMATREKTRKREGELVPRSTMTALAPWDEMERWFDEFTRQGWLHPFRWDWPLREEQLTLVEGRLPKVDVIDREAEIVVRAELPGVGKDGVELTVTDQTMLLRAETRHEEKEEKGEYYRHEMSRGEYQRTLQLPAAVDGEKATATFRNGVLEVTLPKLEKTPRSKISID